MRSLSAYPGISDSQKQTACKHNPRHQHPWPEACTYTRLSDSSTARSYSSSSSFDRLQAPALSGNQAPGSLVHLPSNHMHKFKDKCRYPGIVIDCTAEWMEQPQQSKDQRKKEGSCRSSSSSLCWRTVETFDFRLLLTGDDVVA